MIMDKLRRAAADEPELLAELGDARDRLAQAEVAAEVAISAARARVTAVQARLDEWRRGAVAEHAQAWRTHAEELRRRAAEAGDATTVVSVNVYGGLDGARTEPRLEFTRNVLSDEAARADGTASHLEGRLSAGDALAGEQLALLVSQLEPLPVEEPEPVAV
jgi:hypothetical protein